MVFMSAAAISDSTSRMMTKQELPPTAAPSRYLDWRERPEPLQQVISTAFDALVRQTESHWECNGEARYDTLGINEHTLMKTAIQQAPKERKAFYALDIGAGNFQWCHALADFINNQADLPKDVTIHIIGIRGERYLGDQITTKGQCKIYSFGSFRVEELSNDFKKYDLDLTDRIDLAVSRWCFCHLADPCGTFVQTYDLLRPQTGFLILDGFTFLLDRYGSMPNGRDLTDVNRFMTQLILDTKAPFLTKQFAWRSSFASQKFILQRPNASPCLLPMSYLRVSPIREERYHQHCVTFQRTPQKSDDEHICLLTTFSDFERLQGDKALYNWLRSNNLFIQEERTLWRPFKEKTAHQGTPPLHQAILNGGDETIQTCLARGDDINEVDLQGNAAIHIAIQTQQYRLFHLLLTKGASLKVKNKTGLTPLALAASLDKESRFTKDLTQAEAPNSQGRQSCPSKP
jgi:SAM-dependent methyltransferase